MIPLLITVPPQAAVVAAALLYLALSISIQRKLVNPLSMIERQVEMSRIQKELGALVKEKGPAHLIEAKQKELMPHMKASMKASLKPMVLMLLLYPLVYYYVLPMVPFGMPVKSVQSTFFAATFVLGFAVVMLLNRYDTKRYHASRAANTDGDTASVK